MHEKAVKGRRQKLRQLLKDRINALKHSPNTNCSAANCVQKLTCRAAYAPIYNVDEVKCSAVDDFMKANEENNAYDGMSTLPEEAWSELAANGLLVILDARRHFVEDVLNKLLVEGVTRVDNSALSSHGKENAQPPLPPLQLPSSFSVHHAAAFFKIDYPWDSSGCTRRGLVYSDIVTWFSICGKYNTLESGAVDWKKRAEEGGASATPEKWTAWRMHRQCKWEGERSGTEIALALLEELGYETEETGTHRDGGTERRDEEHRSNTKGYVTMEDMDAKGDIFVCLRCPEEGRAKRSWKDLVC